MHDVYLDGTEYTEADRTAARQAAQAAPSLPALARANRAFTARAVHHAARHSVRQILNIGAGLTRPTHPYETARTLTSAIRGVSVDHDPAVVAHGQAALAGRPDLCMIRADLQFPEEILRHPQLTQTLDLTQPVALLLVSVLHHLTDDHVAREVTAELVDALAPGSMLILSHATDDTAAGQAVAAAQVYHDHGMPLALRGWDAIRGFFSGLRMVRPGLAPLAKWAPTAPAAKDELWAYAGIGIKPRLTS